MFCAKGAQNRVALAGRVRCTLRSVAEDLAEDEVDVIGSDEGARAVVRLGIDIGGSGIKGAPVDTRQGQLVGARVRLATPQPSTPAAVIDVVAQIASDIGVDGPVGVTF